MATGIYSRKVTRWYFNGKGYASEAMAYRAAAKAALLDHVLGKREVVSDEVTEWNGSTRCYEYLGGRPQLKGVTGDGKERIRELFAEAFPHYNGDNDCYDYCDRDENGDYRSPSCSRAQKRWLANKVQELMSQDAPATQEGSK